MEKSYYEQEWDKLKEETKDKPELPVHVRLAMRSNVGPDGEEDHSNDHKIFKDKGLYKPIDEEKYKRAPASHTWQKFDEAGQWPNRPITEEEFKEHCGPEVYAKVEEIRRERRFYDIMEGKLECSREMRDFWPIVDTSTNARRQVPEPWPWWFTLIGMIGGLIWFYVIFKYLIANG